MKMDKMMCGSRELEFAIFCIENIASRLHVDAQKVYLALSEQTNILKDILFQSMRYCTHKVRITLWMI